MHLTQASIKDALLDCCDAADTAKWTGAAVAPQSTRFILRGREPICGQFSRQF
jgi:hypothetical protein